MALKTLRGQNRERNFVAALVVLLVTLSLLFCKSYLPGYTVFSNDGPLGALMAQCRSMPGSGSLLERIPAL